MFNRNGILCLVLALLCLITRLPQLASSNLLLDGDECVLGLMAKHLYMGNELPLFFYGQAYGFSFIETSFVSLFYTFGGISDMSVKLAMLSLWTCAVIFFFLALKNISNRPRLAFLLTILLILSPAWAVWSMKARGGYLTAFTASNLVLYLLFRKEAPSRFAFFITGVLTIIIYQSQLLWLAGLVPFILYQLYKGKKINNGVTYAAGLVATGLVFYLLKKDLPHFFEPAVINLEQPLLTNIGRIAPFLYHHLTGQYYLYFLHKPDIAGRIFSIIFMVIIGLLLLVGCYAPAKKRQGTGILLIAITAVVLTLLYTIPIYAIEPRYLLPLTGYVLIALCLVPAAVPQTQKILRPIIFLLMALGTVSLYQFKDYRFCGTTKSRLQETLHYLEKQQIHHTFCNDPLLTWQIIFYSDELVLSRYYYPPGRYAQYTAAVDDALAKGLPTAVIDFEDDEDDFFKSGIPYVHINDFFISRNVSKETLKEKRFLFSETSEP